MRLAGMHPVQGKASYPEGTRLYVTGVTAERFRPGQGGTDSNVRSLKENGYGLCDGLLS